MTMNGENDLGFKVHLLAFGKKDEIREVYVPYEELSHDLSDLSRIFYYGQNDFQPQNHPSLSMGDVIEYNGAKYLICSVGFRKLSGQEWDDINALTHMERVTWVLTKHANV